jgi:GntR family transcriptional regulator / MocR family aminotransferase
VSEVRSRSRRISAPRGTTLLIPLDPGAPEPLHQQVYHGLREAILSGRLHAGAQIPSSRWLADYIGVSRTTVLGAFDQLVAEGYIVGVVGSGSYVARQLPDHLLQVRRASVPVDQRASRAAPLADRVARLRENPTGFRRLAGQNPAFRLGVPPVDQFPVSVWARLAAARYRAMDASQLFHGSARGTPALREAIVTHHTAARGVRCTPEQVIVVASAQEAMDLAFRVVLNPGDAAWFEDPGYPGARGALVTAGARIVPIPVDASGLDVERGIATEPAARLVYVTPSHQCPTGSTLSLERRLALLDWAARSDAWILEDDYDSEYRYTGRPLTALQGLDVSDRVLYIGTFNKTVFPALRLAYLVLPKGLVDAALAFRSLGAQHAPTIDQGILTDFLIEGHYARHLRAMRVVCRERRDALMEAAALEAAGMLELERPETGLHLVAWLPPGVDDRAASAAAAAHGIDAAALSSYSVGGTTPRGGLLLGYGALRPPEIAAGMRALAAALRTLDAPARG